MEEALEVLAYGFALTLFFGVILGFIALMRWFRYKETIELARQGMLNPRNQARGRRRMSRTRRAGTIVTAIGVAMTIGLATIGLDPYSPLLGPWLLGGLIPLGVGVALLRISNDEREEWDSAELPPNNQDEIPPHKMP